MRLVEVITTGQTSPATKERMSQYLRSIGKVPVMCKDSPGSVVNWLLYNYFINAIRYHEENPSVSIADIDKAMRLGAAIPQGPFELMDRIGIDIVHQVVGNWHEKSPDNPRFLPTETLTSLMKRHRLGRKTTRGFYDY